MGSRTMAVNVTSSPRNRRYQRHLVTVAQQRRRIRVGQVDGNGGLSGKCREGASAGAECRNEIGDGRSLGKIDLQLPSTEEFFIGSEEESADFHVAVHPRDEGSLERNTSSD